MLADWSVSFLPFPPNLWEMNAQLETKFDIKLAGAPTAFSPTSWRTREIWLLI
jgi:hypothetical protein